MARNMLIAVLFLQEEVKADQFAKDRHQSDLSLAVTVAVASSCERCSESQYQMSINNLQLYLCFCGQFS